MRILHLTLKRKWFDLIAKGEKKEEYRLAKPYWYQRLFQREYDEVHFRNGYRPDSPFMRVQSKGVGLSLTGDYFIISLGDILEVRNYQNIVWQSK